MESVLLFRTRLASKEYQIGMAYLQEARQIFKDCNAELDLREVELEFSGKKLSISKYFLSFENI